MADKTKKLKKSKSAAKSASKSATKVKTKTKTKVDPITLSVVRGVLETTQREMTLSLEKTARSSRVQSRARLFDRTVQRQAGDDPAGPGHPDPSRLAHSGDEGGRASFSATTSTRAI